MFKVNKLNGVSIIDFEPINVCWNVLAVIAEATI